MKRSRRSATTIAALLVAAYLLAGFYSVATDESAVALRFGRIVERDALPGIHWNLPWPLGRTIVDQTATSFIMPIGFRYVERAGEAPVSDLWLTGDANIVTARLTVQYSLASLTDFSFAHEAPRELLRKAGERVISELLAGEGVDAVLTDRRQALGRLVQQRLQAVVDRHHTGIRVQSVSIQELSPPLEGGVRGAFQEVQNASSDRERMIQEAHAYAAQVGAETVGQAQAIVSAALADAHGRVESARGRSQRFTALAAEHARARAITEQRLYLETVERLLPKIETYVIEPGRSGTVGLRVVR